MNILIDIQSLQTGSRLRGIGHYTLGLVKAVIKNCENNEVHLLLNGLMNESICDIYKEFENILSKNKIHVWHGLGGFNLADDKSSKIYKSSLNAYSKFINDLSPDVVLCCSMFEAFDAGYFCDFSKIRKSILKACIIYDFIPYENPKSYIPDLKDKLWYFNRMRSLNSIDVFLTISDYTKNKVLEILRTKNAYTIQLPASECFYRETFSCIEKKTLYGRIGVNEPYILYCGGLDERKNVHNLILAFRSMTNKIKQKYQLIIPCGRNNYHIKEMRKKYLSPSNQNDICFCKDITNDDLRILYNNCKLFVFPSKEEGLGLPILEAMKCGAPVIASNATSIPEVVNLDIALFDPNNIESIAKKMELALTDEEYRNILLKNSFIQNKKYSEDKVAKTIYAIFNKYTSKHKSFTLGALGGGRFLNKLYMTCRYKLCLLQDFYKKHIKLFHARREGSSLYLYILNQPFYYRNIGNTTTNRFLCFKLKRTKFYEVKQKYVKENQNNLKETINIIRGGVNFLFFNLSVLRTKRDGNSLHIYIFNQPVYYKNTNDITTVRFLCFKFKRVDHIMQHIKLVNCNQFKLERLIRELQRDINNIDKKIVNASLREQPKRISFGKRKM